MAGGEELSRLDKVLWPDAGVTKGDLIGYVRAMAPALLRYLHDRPLTVKRYPDGIRAQAFFQKNTPGYAPSFVRTVSLRAGSAGRDVRYAVANNERTLVWFANQAAIELHPWLSRTDRLDRPDFLVFDLDPPEGRFEDAVRAARLVREALAEHGLAGCVKTSGAKGVHVFVPLVRRYPYGVAQLATRRIADRAAALDPDLATTEFRIADRRGRVFVDFTRMGRGQHVVAPYSPRARPGAPVSFPVPWDELGSIEPRDFTVQTAPDLITDRESDPWTALLPAPQYLPAELTRPPG